MIWEWYLWVNWYRRRHHAGHEAEYSTAELQLAYYETKHQGTGTDIAMPGYSSGHPL